MDKEKAIKKRKGTQKKKEAENRKEWKRSAQHLSFINYNSVPDNITLSAKYPVTLISCLKYNNKSLQRLKTAKV